MKYIVFAEWCSEDLDKVTEKSLQLMADQEKFPEKYSKALSPPNLNLILIHITHK